MHRIAVIDIGSNAIRYTVADVLAHDALTIVADERAQTRLATGLVSTGRLSGESISASLEAIAAFLALAREHRVDAVRAIATAAVRAASNGQEFVERVRQELGLVIEVIDGRREARLALACAVAEFELPDPVCVVDIGGGSLEFVILRGGRAERTVSLPLGAVVVLSRLPAGEAPPPAEVLSRVRRGIREEIADALGGAADPVTTAICSGGTFTSLVGAVAARRGEPTTDIHRTQASIEELRAISSEVAACTLDERGRIPGIAPYRAQTVLPGSLVILELLSLLGTRTVIANRRGIREGVMIEMARQLHTGLDQVDA